jgi:hypothetical protein
VRVRGKEVMKLPVDKLGCDGIDAVDAGTGHQPDVARRLGCTHRRF